MGTERLDRDQVLIGKDRGFGPLQMLGLVAFIGLLAWLGIDYFFLN